MALRRLTYRAATLTTAIAIAGCGGSVGFAPPPAAAPSSATLGQIRSVITGFARAMAGGQGSSACALLDAQAQQQIAQQMSNGQSDDSLSNVELCQQAIATAGAQLSRDERAVLDTIQIGSVTVEQDAANVEPSQITSPDSRALPAQTTNQFNSPVGLVLQNGQWLIDSLE
jgi:hypothetical protein